MSKLKKITYTVSGIILLIIIWEIVAFATKQLFLPEFFTCLVLAFQKLGNALTWASLGMTFLRLFISLIISSILGIFVGLLAGYFEPIHKILRPIISVLKAFPTIALVLLLAVFVKWFYIYVVIIVCFPIIYQAVSDGASTAFKRFELDLRLNGYYKVNSITKVVLPLTLPNIVLGFIQTFSLGLKVQLMAEILSYRSNSYGLGYLVNTAYQNVEYHSMMAYVLLALIISLFIDASLYLLSKKVKEEIL